MEYRIVNPYCDAYKINAPVCKTAFCRQELETLFMKAVDEMFPSATKRIRRNEVLTCINLFVKFVKRYNKEKIIPNENLLEEFREALKMNDVKKKSLKPCKDLEVRRAVDYTRKILNEYFLPRGLILRKILNKQVFFKYKRFFRLSKTTQKIILEYEEDGRKVKVKKKYYEKNGKEYFRYEVNQTSSRLSGMNRKSRIDRMLTILDKLDQNAIEDIEKSDLERFLSLSYKEGREKTAIKDLEESFSVFCNALATGHLKKHPYDDLLLEKSKKQVNYNFIMPDEIKKIEDLNSVNWKDPVDVRRRCLVMFAYDMGFRVSTLTKIRVSDLANKQNGQFSVKSLDVVNAKGHYFKGDKEDMQFPILFDQTTPIFLKRWMEEARSTFNPKTDHLFVSHRGTPLTSSGMRRIIYDCGRQLGILSYKGKLPSPHVFRHTLATLNIKPFGDVDPILLQRRLTHMDLRTLIDTYVHRNPLAELKEYEKIREKRRNVHIIDKVRKEDLSDLLDSLPTAEPKSIQDIRRAYNHQKEKRSNKREGVAWREDLTETEAVQVLRRFKVTYRALREWALQEEGVCRFQGEDSQRRYFYNKRYLDGIIEDYIGIDEAQRKFGGSRAHFFRLLKKCKKIKIGRKTLALNKDFLRFMIQQ